jgi:hypothetical protein
MIVVRIVAVLLIVALVLVLVFFGTRDRRYLTWARRLFLVAVVTMLGLMLFYFIERLVYPPTASQAIFGGGLS